MSRPASREIVRDFIYLSAARFFSLAVSLVRSLFIPRFLGPASYGMWKTFGIVQSYTQFADLGALAALKREIPYWTRRGDGDRLAEVRDVAFLVNHAALLSASAIVMGASFWVPEPAYARATRLFVLLLYANQVHSFFEQLLFWRKDFAWASRLSLLQSVIETGLAVGGTWLWGLDGLILGTFVAYALAAILQLRRIGFEIGFRFRWGAWMELIRIGFPSHLNGLLYNILMSVDRVLILPTLGLAALGLYGLGMTINEYLFQFAYQLGNAISPRLVERWSETESLATVRPMVEKPTIAIAVAAPAILGTVWFVSEAVIAVALPEYRDALLPLRILLVGTFFSSLHRGLSSFFLAIRKQGRLLPVYAGAIGLNALLVTAALAYGLGIAGAAAATTLTLAAFSLTLIAMAQWVFGGGLASHLRFTGLLLAPLAWGAAAVAAGSAAAATLAGRGPVASAAAGAAVFAVVYAPALVIGWRRLGGGRLPMPGSG